MPRISVSMPAPLVNELRSAAKDAGVSVSVLVTALVDRAPWDDVIAELTKENDG